MSGIDKDSWSIINEYLWAYDRHMEFDSVLDELKFWVFACWDELRGSDDELLQYEKHDLSIFYLTEDKRHFSKQRILEDGPRFWAQYRNSYSVFNI